MKMINYIYSPRSIENKLNKLLRYRGKNENSTRSLSGIYKALRKDSRIEILGDYPLLNFILVKTADKLPEHRWSKNQVFTAMEYCRFWEEEGRLTKYIPSEWNRFIRR